MDVNLAHLLQEQARRRPQARALIDGTGRSARSVTFAELDVRAGRAAALLRRQGLAAGDRVLFMADGQIVEDTEPETFFTNPRSDRAKDFLGKILSH